MTLAALLLIAFLSFTTGPVPRADLQQPATESAVTSQTQDPVKPSTPASTQPAQQSSPQISAKPHSHPKGTRKKKPATSDCNAPASSSSATPNSDVPSQQQTDPSAESGSVKNSTTATAPKNCPPPKIIVRQGGTSEPSIQLAGGPGADEAARKRDAINQMLGVTDQNLKKAAARQLTDTQQATVMQAKQFVEQSKQAITNGDMERARTLAWKAQVLSEDLVNPEK
jgi:hypothetical protein